MYCVEEVEGTKSVYCDDEDERLFSDPSIAAFPCWIYAGVF